MGLIALALAALGLYGVLSHAVTQRMREYGVSLAAAEAALLSAGLLAALGPALRAARPNPLDILRAI